MQATQFKLNAPQSEKVSLLLQKETNFVITRCFALRCCV